MESIVCNMIEATGQSFVHKVESAHRLGLCEAVHAEASLVWLNKGLIGMETIEEKAGHSRILLSEMKAVISTFKSQFEHAASLRQLVL